jgi:hypothetical protein
MGQIRSAQVMLPSVSPPGLSSIRRAIQPHPHSFYSPQMPLAPGSKLGPYEILGALGAGGMGEVYRARDPRLGREVAIKILPASSADNSARMRRFEQEARATAALSHPNILAVFDIGSQDNSPYIVSELLEGETLRSAPDERAAACAQSRRLCAADRSRTRRRTRSRHFPSRSETGKHFPRARRPREDSRTSTA